MTPEMHRSLQDRLVRADTAARSLKEAELKLQAVRSATSFLVMDDVVVPNSGLQRWSTDRSAFNTPDCLILMEEVRLRLIEHLEARIVALQRIYVET